MRHFHLQDQTACDWKDMFYDRTNRHFHNLGECIYTINTSNFRWPDDVSYLEMIESRRQVLVGVFDRT